MPRRFEFIPQPLTELPIFDEPEEEQQKKCQSGKGYGNAKNQKTPSPCTLKTQREFQYFFDIKKKQSDEYKQAAFNELLDDIPQVSLSSIKNIFARFNYHYCPTYAFIRKHLKEVDFELYKQYYFSVEDKHAKDGVFYMKILAKERRRKLHSIELPNKLKAEVGWTRKNRSRLIEEAYDFPNKIETVVAETSKLR